MNTTRPPNQSTLLEQLNLFLTGSYPCSYLPDTQARSQAVASFHGVDDGIYSELVRLGFRRSGQHTYRPYCDHCRACISVRLKTREFHPSRSQRRSRNRFNQTLRPIALENLPWSAEHFNLYVKYQKQRHPGNLESTQKHDYIEFMLNSTVSTHMVEFRDPDHVLRMVSIFDILDDGLSAVYTFYDVDYLSGLGTYAILWLIELCTLFDLPYLYLGYWIEQSPKMAYKTRFQPLQYFAFREWRDDPPDTQQLLKPLHRLQKE